ncbi:putative E3 ubiquitin-protein ligase XBAT35 [Impatiens glandulifera]|uniref:putative E3 ubiquitin-protein ligase XBAT35 n=1 Tax=Impatiens glandulifera TaxID=253017 RepID=UPI001FB0FC1C|nr:putative E3 ubiquitin-protein ligase XBAT35 [Impatiens glandulifera]
MGQHQSKDELLYRKSVEGNVQAVKALRTEGAGLEWVDRDGKTPLITVSLYPQGFIMAETLINLGANVDAYRSGRHAGTPLHHAAKRGLEQTVRLLLSRGANPLLRNDEGQTPIDIARLRGFSNVVHAIENQICFFSGWLREFNGPGFLKVLAPQLMSRKIWGVVVPFGSHNAAKPVKLEFVIYTSLQDAQPHMVIDLRKASIEEPKFNKEEVMLIIHDITTNARYKFASPIVGDGRQIQFLYNACRGIPQKSIVPTMHDIIPASANQAEELSIGLNSSIQSLVDDKESISFGSTVNGWMNEPAKEEYNSWGMPEGTRPCIRKVIKETNNTEQGEWIGKPDENGSHGLNNGWVMPAEDNKTTDGDTGLNLHELAQKGPRPSAPASSSCSICWEAAVEGACVPCGHMAGCMGCLNEIKTKKGECPVCRCRIDQVIKIYTV